MGFGVYSITKYVPILTTLFNINVRNFDTRGQIAVNYGEKGFIEQFSRAIVINKILNSVTTLCRNNTLRLVKNSRTTWNIQAECYI